MDINTVKRQENEQRELIGYLLNNQSFVPLDVRNRHYRAILEWIKKGNIPEEADPPTEPPPPTDWEAVVDSLDLSGIDKATGDVLKAFFKQVGEKLG